MDLRNKKITVMGLGLHGGGLGVTKWLAQQGARVLVTDLKTCQQLLTTIQKLKKYKIQYVLGKHRTMDFENADMIFKNPGVPKESKYIALARKKGIPIETDMSLFFRLCPAPVIGITGTKGKSTLTMITDEIFKAVGKNPVMAGNIRISPLEILKKIKKSTPVILELSSWQLEDMAHLKVSPHIAVLTNIMPDHLNRYQNMTEYIKAKKLIFQYQKQDDYIILNRDNPITKKLGQEVKSRRFWFSFKYFTEENGSFIKNGWLIFRLNGQKTKVMLVKDIKIPGQINLYHFLAAVNVAMINKIKPRIIKKAIQNFKGVPGRLELVREYKGIKFYNDTTATTPEAAIAALDSFKQKVILIAGGADKKLDFKKLSEKIKQKVKFLILLKGTATNKLIKALNKIQSSKFKALGSKSMVQCSSMQEAVKRAWKNSKESDVVLLSPGAASFGLFVNEFDRGDQFNLCVKEIK